MWPSLKLEKGKIICNFLFPFSSQLSGVANVVFSKLNVEVVMVIAAVFILRGGAKLVTTCSSSFFQPPHIFLCGDAASWTDGTSQGRAAGWVAGYWNGARWDSTSLLDARSKHAHPER